MLNIIWLLTKTPIGEGVWMEHRLWVSIKIPWIIPFQYDNSKATLSSMTHLRPQHPVIQCRNCNAMQHCTPEQVKAYINAGGGENGILNSKVLSYFSTMTSLRPFQYDTSQATAQQCMFFIQFFSPQSQRCHDWVLLKHPNQIRFSHCHVKSTWTIASFWVGSSLITSKCY